MASLKEFFAFMFVFMWLGGLALVWGAAHIVRERDKAKKLRARKREMQRAQETRQKQQQAQQKQALKALGAIRAADAGNLRRDLGKALATSSTSRAAQLLMVLPAWPVSRQILGVIRAIDDLKRACAPALACGVSKDIVDSLMSFATRMEVGICAIAALILEVVQQEDTLQFSELSGDATSRLTEQSGKIEKCVQEVSGARAYLKNAKAEATANRLSAQSDDFEAITEGLKSFIADSDPLSALREEHQPPGPG